jgi:hypothetical protein
MAIIARLGQQSVDIADIMRDLEEVPVQVSEEVPPVTTIDYAIGLDAVKIFWERPHNIANFELRYGTVWDTALRILITNTTSAVIDPLTPGQHTYLIKSIDGEGRYSAQATRLDIAIPSIGAVNVTHDVIDNYVLLYWTVPYSPFRISHYIIKRNGQEIGRKDGTFTSIFEQVSGTYRYSVIPVNIAGHQGPEAVRDVIVSQPPDYVLLSNRTSTFAGFKGNCIVDLDKLLFSIENQTWEQHFIYRGWGSIQDQINAGYPYYAQPSPSTAFYEESGIYTFDYGVVLSGSMITLTWAYETITGSGHNIQALMRVSPDNIAWGAWVPGKSNFFTNFRYLQIRLEATALD